MKKLLLASVFVSSLAIASQAYATVAKGFYQGDKGKEEIQVQVDGHQRYFYCPRALCHPLLDDKVGYLVEIKYKTEALRKASNSGTKEVIEKITVLSGTKDQELNEVRRAAENGNADAQNKLGAWYEKGSHGLHKDYKEAYNWYADSAEKGNYKAMHNLGVLLVDEKITDISKETALELYLAMAQSGIVLGFEDVGDYYNKFAKTQKEKDASLAFYKVAAQAGRESARKKLVALGVKVDATNQPVPRCSGTANHNTVQGKLVKKSAYMDYYRYAVDDGKGNVVEVNIHGRFPELDKAHVGNMVRLDYGATYTGLNRYTATCEQETRYINGSGMILQ